MKKMLLAISMFLILTAAQNSFARRVVAVAEEDRVFTPAANSAEYKAILAAVNKQHPKITKIPAVMRVQGVWARFALVAEVIPEEEDQSRGKVTGPNLILKKIGGEWQIVYSFEPDNDDYMLKRVKGVPDAIKILNFKKVAAADAVKKQ